MLVYSYINGAILLGDKIGLGRVQTHPEDA